MHLGLKITTTVIQGINSTLRDSSGLKGTLGGHSKIQESFSDSEILLAVIQRTKSTLRGHLGLKSTFKVI